MSAARPTTAPASALTGREIRLQSGASRCAAPEAATPCSWRRCSRRPLVDLQTAPPRQGRVSRITCLGRTCYQRLNFAQGFGSQRVHIDDGLHHETMAVIDGDAVLLSRGHHLCCARYSFKIDDFDMMAGPLRRWRSVPDPTAELIEQRDA